MVLFHFTRICLMLLFFNNVTSSPLTSRSPVPQVDFDVLVIGGGPAGLSALSGLVRVRRKAILLDSGEYRNAATRHMHDVIGSDGEVPAAFRYAARQGIAKYPTATMANATVETIVQINGTDGPYFIATDTKGTTYKGRKVILGTGCTDVLPETPGLQENFGKGIYWCPWCDGYEHRDQPFGILGPIDRTVGDVLEVETLNKDIILFTNSSYADATTVAALEAKNPVWKQQLDVYQVQIEDRIIENITKIQDSDVFDGPGATAEHDIFKVTFTDGGTVVRSAFMTDFSYKQTSLLGQDLGVEIVSNKMVVDSNTRTRVKGVFAVGDANNDGATNVPHAMFSGKRAAVYCHVELAKEDVNALITRSETEEEVMNIMGREVEELWEDMS